MFGKLTENGVCAECSTVVVAYFLDFMKQLDREWKREKSAATFAARLRAADEHARILQRAVGAFEARGIDFGSPTWSEQLREAADKRVYLIDRELRAIWDRAIALATPEARQTDCLKAWRQAVAAIVAVQAELAAAKGPESEGVAEWVGAARQQLEHAEIRVQTEAAGKTEFVGNVKKAVAGYREALYAAQRSSLNEHEKAELVAILEHKLAELE